MFLNTYRHKVFIAPNEIKNNGLYEDAYLVFSSDQKSFKTPLKISVTDPPAIVAFKFPDLNVTTTDEPIPDIVAAPSTSTDLMIKTASMTELGKMLIEFSRQIILPNIAL